jgi:hypothetical protein
MLSRRSWNRFEIAAINEAAKMLTATDGRAIAFANAQTWQVAGPRRTIRRNANDGNHS